MSASSACSDLTFAWPDGQSVFAGLDLTVPEGRNGLVGVNGSGKSTLLRLIAGELAPARGSVRGTGSLEYLPQDAAPDAGLPVDAVLGIATARRSLHAIERGEVTADALAAVADQWDVEERARATLDRLGLDAARFDQRVSELSGGESVLLALAARLLQPSRTRRSVLCARPSPMCASRSGSWPRRGSSWTGAGGTARRCGTPSGSPR